MPQKKKEKIQKVVPPKRKRGVKYCSICNEPGADEVWCGYCKERTGSKVVHFLCNRCFLGGCPVAFPREEAVDILKKLINS